MVQQSFANKGTRIKLDTVFEYANFYSRALRDKPAASSPFRLTYLDAFAGTGEVPFASEMPLLEGVVDAQNFVEGSARRALHVDYPFSRYVFSDFKQKHTRDLEKLKNEFPHLSDRIQIERGDANTVVTRFCSNLSSSDRALIFLDPFGNQVKWQTLETIASTKKVDLWYLFPAWIGVARQVKGSGELVKDAEPSIDAMFGPHDWRSECLKSLAPAQRSFFINDNQDTVKVASADGITRFMIQCMEGIFGGGVSRKWLPLGRDGRHYYSLIFACSNPTAKAKVLAQRVANEIMTRK